jgi:hypothetical protein
LPDPVLRRAGARHGRHRRPEWNEKGFDYDNQQGISVGKILGFLKPKFGSIYEATAAVEDFGVISAYVAQ